MESERLPTRVRVLIIGGGIHGVGLLHDMASRGWTDIHLIEKSTLGDGTSSKSTKLIHGGLRYLKRLSDYGLVAEALKERSILMSLVPDLVRPVELLFPIMREGGMPRLLVKAGLTIYDKLAGKYGINAHKTLLAAEVTAKAPMLDQSLATRVYSFWDGQTDDLGLVRRVAASALKLGAGISEGVEATRVTPSEDGWDVEIKKPNGDIQKMSALYVVNATGPWANRLLERSKLAPTHRAINDKGVHLLMEDIGLKSGLFLQSIGDGRIFFVLPWGGYTLVGTTEDLYPGDPDAVGVSDAEVRYLLDNCNRFFTTPLKEANIVRAFAGLRWLAVEAGHGISDTSRAHVIGEKESRRGLLMTLYGGKLTTYRNLSRQLGDRITKHFGEYHPSTTDQASSWAVATDRLAKTPTILQRFPQRA